MSDQLPTYFETEYSKNWEMLAQQMDSRLGTAVTPTTITGKRRKFNQLDEGEMSEVTERKGDTPDGDSTGDSYWIFRRKFEKVIVFDEDDEIQLGTIALPDSDEVASMAAASNRTKDRVIIQAFDGTRYIGENGTTSNSFSGGMSIAVDYVASGSTANSGLTLAKISRAKKLLDEQEVDDGDRYFAHSSQQLQDMLLVDKMTSEDYASVKALVDGKIDRFLGFKFVRTELLTRNTSTDVRTCFAWHKSGIKFAEGGRNTHMDMLPSRRHCKQIRGVYRCGAVRTENEKVVRIYADESP
jgi:hypothetical protein